MSHQSNTGTSLDIQEIFTLLKQLIEKYDQEIAILWAEIKSLKEHNEKECANLKLQIGELGDRLGRMNIPTMEMIQRVDGESSLRGYVSCRTEYYLCNKYLIY